MKGLKLVIGNCNYSSWSLRPWLFLRHHGISFEEQRISLSTPSAHQQLASFFSNQKVPVLFDGEQEIWDSLAILEYLSESFPQLNGWPVERNARATARSVSAEMHSSFMDLRAGLPMNCRRIFPGYGISGAIRRDIDRITELWGYCRDQFGDSGPWLFGDFSIADCMYAPVVVRFIGYDVALNPEAEEYASTVYQSVALQEWIERGRQEPEVIEDEEVDWESQPA